MTRASPTTSSSMPCLQPSTYGNQRYACARMHACVCVSFPSNYMPLLQVIGYMPSLSLLAYTEVDVKIDVYTELNKSLVSEMVSVLTIVSLVAGRAAFSVAVVVFSVLAVFKAAVFKLLSQSCLQQHSPLLPLLAAPPGPRKELKPSRRLGEARRLEMCLTWRRLRTW